MFTNKIMTPKCWKLTSAFEADFVERVSNVRIRRKPIEIRRVGDCDVALSEYLANGFAGVPVKQVVRAYNHHAPPVVLQEDLQKEVGHFAKWSERARQGGVGYFVVKVWISCHPGDEWSVEEGRHLRHSPTCWTVNHKKTKKYCQQSLQSCQTMYWLPTVKQ